MTARREIPVVILVEAKDEETIEGIQPGLVPDDQICSSVQDILSETKRDAMLGWRVLSVRPA